MKKVLALFLALACGPALAQQGIFPANSVWGNATGSSAQAKATPLTSFTGFFANPTGAVGLSVINGSATTAMRSDAAPPLSASVQSALTGTNAYILNGTGAFGFSAEQFVTLTQGGLGGSQSAATVNQVPVYPGSGGAAVPTALTTLLNTVCTAAPSTCAGFFGYGDVRWWGAKCDWNGTSGTDDSTAINAAIVAASNNFKLILPPTPCAVASTINMSFSRVAIYGVAGNGSNGATGVWATTQSYLSGFVWTGSASGTLISITIPSIAGSHGFIGNGLHDVALQAGPNVAAVGVKIVGGFGGDYSNIALLNFSTAGFDLDGDATAANSGSAHNKFSNIYSYTTTGNGAAIRFGCITNQGAFYNDVYGISALSNVNANTAINFCTSDNNTIFNVYTFQTGTGTNVPIAFNSGATSNTINGFSSNNIAAHAFTGSVGNAIWNIDSSNVVPIPITDSGVALEWTYKDGRATSFTPVVDLGGTACTTAGTPCVYTAAGTYVKQGQITLASWRVTFTTLGTGTGALTVTGLPKTAVGAQSYGGSCTYAANLAGFSGALVVRIDPNTGTAIYQSVNGGTANITQANLTNTSDVICSMTYLSPYGP